MGWAALSSDAFPLKPKIISPVFTYLGLMSVLSWLDSLDVPRGRQDDGQGGLWAGQQISDALVDIVRRLNVR